MLPPLVSPGNLAILQQAIDEALTLAATRKGELTVNQLADLMCRAFEAGERDPAKLAAAVFPALPSPVQPSPAQSGVIH